MVLAYGRTSERIGSISLASWVMKWGMELKSSFGQIFGVGWILSKRHILNYIVSLDIKRLWLWTIFTTKMTLSHGCWILFIQLRIGSWNQSLLLLICSTRVVWSVVVWIRCVGKGHLEKVSKSSCSKKPYYLILGFLFRGRVSGSRKFPTRWVFLCGQQLWTEFWLRIISVDGAWLVLYV